MSERWEIDPQTPGLDFYPLLNSVVVPRPIAWVSTRSRAGVDNLAPHSFFTVASVDPPILQFTSVGEKDSLRNVRETGEFVIASATRELRELVNRSATPFPAGESEFDAVAIAREPSAVVGPPRVRDSPVAVECRFAGEHSFGESTVVFGEVVRLALSRSVAPDDPLTGGTVDVRRLDPMSRLDGDDWGTVGEIIPLPKISLDAWRDGTR